MRKLKLNLTEIKDILSREEMRVIQGGYGSDICNECTTDSDCKAIYGGTPNSDYTVCREWNMTETCGGPARACGRP